MQAGCLVAAGWVLREWDAIPVWQIGLALMLGTAAVLWMYLHE
jgi:hypothetical protein